MRPPRAGLRADNPHRGVGLGQRDLGGLLELGSEGDDDPHTLAGLLGLFFPQDIGGER